MTHKLLVLSVLASTFTFACGGSETEIEQTEDDVTSARTQYVDIGQYLTGDEYEKWFSVRRGLEQGFDDICGDTFCGGDFTNLYSLGFTCSVTSKIGKIRECLWSFAGSQEQVDAKTGAIASSPAFFECRIKPTGNAKTFVTGFGDEPLRDPVAGLGGASIYDQLGDCFHAPIGFQPLPEQTEGKFADVQDTATGDTAELYFNGTYAAKQAFDDVCGDTFCEGDYTNLQSLSLRCSQDDAGKLGSCSWTLAGNDTHIDSRGWLKEQGAPFVCKIPVSGTTAELAAVLGATNDTGVLDRTLPGGGTLMDALGDCL